MWVEERPQIEPQRKVLSSRPVKRVALPSGQVQFINALIGRFFIGARMPASGGNWTIASFVIAGEIVTMLLSQGASRIVRRTRTKAVIGP